MKTKLFASALAMAVMTAGFAPSEAVAKPKHYKKAHKYHKKAVKHHYKHHHHRHHDRIKIKYDYDRPKYEQESFGIYTTPSGGLGFHYSENSTRYGSPYGYGFPGYGYFW